MEIPERVVESVLPADAPMRLVHGLRRLTRQIALDWVHTLGFAIYYSNPDVAEVIRTERTKKSLLRNFVSKIYPIDKRFTVPDFIGVADRHGFEDLTDYKKALRYLRWNIDEGALRIVGKRPLTLEYIPEKDPLNPAYYL